jgi:hypothetical protein
MNALTEFFFPHRLHRLAYFIRLIAVNVAACFIYSSVTANSGYWWWIPEVALGIYAMFFIILLRIRDLGMKNWWLLFTLVPIANEVLGLILLFRSPSVLSRHTVQSSASAT